MEDISVIESFFDAVIEGLEVYRKDKILVYLSTLCV